MSAGPPASALVSTPPVADGDPVSTEAWRRTKVLRRELEARVAQERTLAHEDPEHEGICSARTGHRRNQVGKPAERVAQGGGGELRLLLVLVLKLSHSHRFDVQLGIGKEMQSSGFARRARRCTWLKE